MNVLVYVAIIVVILIAVVIAFVSGRNHGRKWQKHKDELKKLMDELEAKPKETGFGKSLPEISSDYTEVYADNRRRICSTKYPELYLATIMYKNDRRTIYFATPLPHCLHETDVKAVEAILPQLYSLDIHDKFQLVARLSPAVDFSPEILDAIFRLILNRMRQKYKWQMERQYLGIIVRPHDDQSFVLKLENLFVRDHEKLKNLLNGVRGISESFFNADDGICVKKYALASWPNIIPEVVEVLNDYFVGGYEIMGGWPDDSALEETEKTE